jgi:Fe(3+) dicitrate transport protein
MKQLSILFICFFISITCGYAQSLKGKILDESNVSIPGVIIRNYTKNKQVLTDNKGAFQIPATVGDSIRIHLQGYEAVTFKVTADDLNQEFKKELAAVSNELDDVIIESQKLEKFDVGRMPLIRGTQITTGTNAVIQVESMSGAKSTANPREMFAKVPGLNIFENDGAGIQVGIGGRGLSPNRTANFNTRQNGYDISADALGYPESYYTPPFEALKAVEIIRGSASLQYGTQFGGLLNFVIKDAPENTPFELTSRVTGGSYGYKGIFNRITGTNNRFFYQFYHQYKEGDGYRSNSEYKQHQAFAQVGYYLNENWKMKLEFTHMNYLAKQAGGLTDYQFEEDPLRSYRNRNWFRVNWNMLAFKSEYEISERGTIDVRVFGMQSSRESLGFLGKVSQADPMGNRDLIQGVFENIGAEARYLQRFSFNKEKEKSIKGAFLVGSRYYKGNTQNNQGSASNASDADFRFLHPDNLDNSSFDFPSTNFSLFNQNIFFLTDRLNVNFGVRYEFISSQANGFYKKYNIHPFTGDTLAVYTLTDSNTVVRNVPLFGAGLNYKVGRFSSAYANYTQNYRAINFSDIRVANPNIVVDSMMKDERGYTVELGIRGLQKKFFTYDVALFAVYYGNKIGLAPKAGTTLKERTNIGNALNVGVETFAEIDLIGMVNDSARQGLNLFVNFAYINATYIQSKEPNYVGNKVEYVSPVILKTGLKYRVGEFTSQIQFSYNAEQYSDATNAVEPSGDAVVGLVPSYFVFDFSCKYTFSKNFQLEGGINNFTNQSYFTRRATAYPGPGILPSDGRTFYVTLQYKFAAKKK